MCARATSTSSYDNSTKAPSAQDCAETWAPEHVPEKRLNFLVMSTYWLQYYPGKNWKPETRTEKKEADFCYLEVCLRIKKVPVMTVRIRKLMIMPTQGSQKWHDALSNSELNATPRAFGLSCENISATLKSISIFPKLFCQSGDTKARFCADEWILQVLHLQGYTGHSHTGSLP